MTQWRDLSHHRQAQTQGRQAIFKDYRIRVASVIRDYGLEDRQQAPDDSLKVHQSDITDSPALESDW